jgi:hypothetical protein
MLSDLNFISELPRVQVQEENGSSGTILANKAKNRQVSLSSNIDQPMRFIGAYVELMLSMQFDYVPNYALKILA